MSKVYLSLRQSERAVTKAAAQVYSAYIAAGQVPEGSEDEWIKRSVDAAIRIAQLCDESITSDGEMG